MSDYWCYLSAYCVKKSGGGLVAITRPEQTDQECFAVALGTYHGSRDVGPISRRDLNAEVEAAMRTEVS